MIKFFRKIRNSLIIENRFSKPASPIARYLLYSIGEIILVVIGILIALQINNWNEDRKLKEEEIKMLSNFKISIKGDLEETSRYDELFDDTDRAIYLLLEHMEQDLPYHDSLRTHFRQITALWSPKIDQETFATLSSTDLNIITNDSLKNELISYYSFAKRRFDVRMKRYANIMEDASKNIFVTRFNELWGNTWNDRDYTGDKEKTMTPIDYEKLKKDSEYLYFLKSLKNQLYWYVRSPLKEAKQKSMLLHTSLVNELKMTAK